MRCWIVLSQWKHGAYAVPVWHVLSECRHEQPYPVSSRHVLSCTIYPNTYAVPGWLVLHTRQQRPHFMRATQLLSRWHEHFRWCAVSRQLYVQHHHRHAHSSACCSCFILIIIVVIVFFFFFLCGREQQQQQQQHRDGISACMHDTYICNTRYQLRVWRDLASRLLHMPSVQCNGRRKRARAVPAHYYQCVCPNVQHQRV